MININSDFLKKLEKGYILSPNLNLFIEIDSLLFGVIDILEQK